MEIILLLLSAKTKVPLGLYISGVFDIKRVDKRTLEVVSMLTKLSIKEFLPSKRIPDKFIGRIGLFGRLLRNSGDISYSYDGKLYCPHQIATNASIYLVGMVHSVSKTGTQICVSTDVDSFHVVMCVPERTFKLSIGEMVLCDDVSINSSGVYCSNISQLKS